ncbi:hypothetical protein [Akkermansia sp.]|uniref:hypothetical protein n=1 Tax=Akkermansia sp. TaxID=1872421 RepID=UPI003A926925
MKRRRECADLKSVQKRKLRRKMSFDNCISISFKEYFVINEVHEMIENNCYILEFGERRLEEEK